MTATSTSPWWPSPPQEVAEAVAAEAAEDAVVAADPGAEEGAEEAHPLEQLRHREPANLSDMLLLCFRLQRKIMTNRPIRARQPGVPSHHANFKMVKPIKTSQTQKMRTNQSSRTVIVRIDWSPCTATKNGRLSATSHYRRGPRNLVEEPLLLQHPHYPPTPNQQKKPPESSLCQKFRYPRARLRRHPVTLPLRLWSRRFRSWLIQKMTYYLNQTCRSHLLRMRHGQRSRAVRTGPTTYYRHGSSP